MWEADNLKRAAVFPSRERETKHRLRRQAWIKARKPNMQSEVQEKTRISSLRSGRNKKKQSYLTQFHECPHFELELGSLSR